MPDEYSCYYKQKASEIDGLTKNTFDDLCRMYVACKGSKFEDIILSSIICKKWKCINDIQNQIKWSSLIFVSFDECYDIYIDSIMYVLDKHVWDDADSSLYQIETAPTAALTTRIESCTNNYMRTSCYDKRYANSTAVQMQSEENCQEIIEDIQIKKDDLYSLVGDLFGNKKYIEALLICSIVTDVTTVDRSGKNKKYPFNVSKVVSFLENPDINTLTLFSELYDIQVSDMKKVLKEFSKYPNHVLRLKVQRSARNLKNIKEFSNILMEE